MKSNIHKKMTNEQAANELKNYHREDGTVPEEITLAIQALETGEIYITGEDYNLYMEGYKAGKKDFEPKQGEWIDHSEDGYVECPFCEHLTTCEDNIDELHYCWNCGADMRKGGAE